MTHAEARRRLLAGVDAEAEAHLEKCAACAEWLDAHDPMVARMRSARPADLALPSRVEARVRAAFRPAGEFRIPGLIAAAVLVLSAIPLGFAVANWSAWEDLRDLQLLASPIPLLVLTAVAAAALAVLAGLLYRELGRAPRQASR